MNDECCDHLMGLIYEASLEPGLWREVMLELSQQVNADTFHLLGWNSKNQAATLNVVSHTGWGRALTSHNILYGSPDPSCMIAPDTDAGVTTNAFSQDFLQPMGLHHALGGCLYRQGETQITLGLLRAPERDPFEPAHALLLDRLLPHLNRALRLMLHAQTTTRSGNLAATGQDAVSLAVIAVDKAARLLHCNRTGEALLKSARVLRIEQGVVACAGEVKGKSFFGALETVTQTGRPVSLLLCNCVHPDARYGVTLTPQPMQGNETDGVLCLIAPLDYRRMATIRQLMQLFGLSAAEARLARALAAGDTLGAYALENDLKLPTVKSQLHAVFEKTGSDRQATLIRVITGIPVVREADQFHAAKQGPAPVPPRPASRRRPASNNR